ncbi:MAG: hypothetical protein HQL93_13585 [Magnetococcales bacterium]|nr:hypothetical protein [Magnetococcales bacterium]
MPLEDFIIYVYCAIDDLLNELLDSQRLRQRGFTPASSDSEVITMEIVGEFMGLDADKAIWRYFRNHWHHWFPKLGSRAAFAKQCANIFKIKQLIQERMANQLGAFTDSMHLIDGFPIPVCHFQRARYSQCFRGEATYGYCASKKETYSEFLTPVCF